MDPASAHMKVCVWRRRPGTSEVLQVRTAGDWDFPSPDDVGDLVSIPIDALLERFAVAPRDWEPSVEHRWVPEDDAGPEADDALTQAGAAAIVWRRGPGGVEYLLLHRAHRGTDEDGDWAWTPPAGALDAGETHEGCAARELREETGLDLPLVRVDRCPHRFNAFGAELIDDQPVRLSAEHDRFEWLPRDAAVARCLPSRVGDTIAALADQIGDAG